MKRRHLIQMAAMMLTAGIVSSCGKKISFTYTEVEVTRQDITTSVTATGTIEPVTSVDVGTQVSGIVSKLYVDYNSIVKAGDVIAELDRTNLLSELSSAQANLKSAQSELEYQQTNHERYKTLYDKGLISANDYEQARLTYIRAQQTVTTQKENVKKAQTNLGYATITSPIDGVVLSADVDEADIGEVKEGQRVSFTVDAFPDDVFQGTVTQVRQQATTESNVVTYEVVISAPNEDLKLKPGLTANVTIYTLELPNVLALPNKALRFNPSEAMLNPGESIHPTESKTKVWVKKGPELHAIPVELGTTNGTLTQVLSGLSEGDKVITEVVNGAAALEEANAPQTQNPFAPRPRNRNNNNNGAKK